MTESRHDQLVRAAKLDAKVNGCTCEPDVTLLELAPLVYESHVGHDDWCPLGNDERSVQLVRVKKDEPA